MVRPRRRRNRMRRGYTQRRTPSRKPMLDPSNEVEVRSFVSNRHYTHLAMQPSGAQKFFSGGQNYRMHELAQEHYRQRYIAGLLVMHYNGYRIANGALYFGLGAALARHDTELSKALLDCRKLITPREVLKAVSTLDLGRRVRAAEKHVKRLQINGVKRKHKFQMPTDFYLKSLNKVKPQKNTATGAVCKHIRRWARTLTEAELRSYVGSEDDEDEYGYRRSHKAYSFTQVWKLLADMCHFNPKKDFPALPWFLPYCFGEHPEHEPKETKETTDPTEELRALTINQRVMEEDISMVAIQRAGLVLCLTAETKAHIVSNMSLDKIFSNIGDLLCPETDLIIAERIAAEASTLGVDGNDRISSILLSLATVLKECNKKDQNDIDEVKFTVQDSEELLPTYLQAVKDVGQKTLKALEDIFQERLVEAREKLSGVSHKPNLVIVDKFCDDYYDSQSCHFVMQAALLAMLFGVEMVSKMEEVGKYGTPQHASEIVALGKLFCTKMKESSHSAEKCMEELIEERRVVPIIALVLQDEHLSDSDVQKRLVRIFEKYHEKVNPSLFVIINDNGRFYGDMGSWKQLRKSKLNYLLMADKRNALGKIVELLTSSFTSLKSVEEQIADVINIIDREGVAHAFRMVTG